MIQARSLRRTLLWWLLVPLLSLLTIGTFAAYRIALSLTESSYDEGLFSAAHDIGEIIDSLQLEGKPPFDLPAIATKLILTDQNDKMFYNIRDQNGILIRGDKNLQSPDLSLHTGNQERQYFNGYIDDLPVRVVSVPVTVKQSQIVFIQVAETLNKRQSLAKAILLWFILPQFFLVLIAATIVYFAVTHGLKPLAELEMAVSSRAPQDLSPLVAPQAPAEAQPLLAAINRLLSQMQSMLSSQNRFIADAAHQMRTPLAGLKAQIALAARQSTLPEMQYSLEQLGVGAERLTHLVNQLLSLARNEPGADRSLQHVSIDLNNLAQNAVSDWINEAIKRDIDLGFEGQSFPVLIVGDALRLNELLSNLLDNAIRYTPKGGRVTVSVTKPATLIVEDNGIGIPAVERHLVFDRFYRVLGTHVEGSGLGLAIVKDIADTHGAQIRIQGGENQTGTKIEVMFPVPETEIPPKPAKPLNQDE